MSGYKVRNRTLSKQGVASIDREVLIRMYEQYKKEAAHIEYIPWYEVSRSYLIIARLKKEGLWDVLEYHYICRMRLINYAPLIWNEHLNKRGMSTKRARDKRLRAEERLWELIDSYGGN